MIKNIAYITFLILVLGSIFLYQYKTTSAEISQNSYISNQPVHKDSNYVEGLLFERYYNEQQPSNPFAALTKGSEFIFRFSSYDSTMLYRILEDSPSSSAKIQVEVYQLNLKDENEDNFDLLIKAQELRKKIGAGTVAVMSKQEFTKIAHSSDVKMASIVFKKTSESSFLMAWSSTPLGEILSLIGLSIFIGILRRISSFLGNWLGATEILILGVFVLLISFLKINAFGVFLSTVLPSIDGVTNVIFSVYGLYNLTPVLLFFLFRHLVNMYKGKYDFTDLEVGKYVFIVLSWGCITYFQDFVLSFSFDEYDVFYRGFDNSLIEAFLLATANFFNNFRAHYFELRRKGKVIDASRIKQETSESELSALQSRVNPHFLYNSLNSIAALSESNPVKTKEMALALSDFYKYSTNREDEIWTTIREEIKMINKYLEVEKIRFGEKLKFKIFANDNARNIKIPLFLIQPLVENAIKYGYNTKDDEINILVSALADKRGKDITIAVQDSGPDFPEDMDMGHGIRSVQKKLNLTYPKDHYLSFSNKRKTLTQPKDRDLYEEHTGKKLIEPEMKIATIILYNPKKDV